MILQEFLCRSIVEINHGIGVLSIPLKVIILTSGILSVIQMAEILDERIGSSFRSNSLINILLNFVDGSYSNHVH